MVDLMDIGIILLIIFLSIIIGYFAFGYLLYIIYRAKRRDGLPFFKYSQCSDYLNLKQEHFSFYNRNNLKLDGSIFYCGKYEDISQLIIFIHGNTHGYEQYLSLINSLCQKGMAVIAYSMQGCGKSEGKNIDCFTHGLLDYQDFCDYLHRRIDLTKNKHLILMGHSWGGYIALNNSVYQEIKFDKVVALSAFEYEPYMIGQLSIIGYAFIPLYLLMHRYKFKELWNIKSSQSVAKSITPSLIIHGENDNIVKRKYSVNKFMKSSANNNFIQYYLAHDCGHVSFLNPASSKALDKIQAKLTGYNYFLKIGFIKKKAKTLASNFNYEICRDINDGVLNKISDFIFNNVKNV